MTDHLQDAIERLKELPKKRQDQIAAALIEVVDSDAQGYGLADEQEGIQR